MEINQTKQVKVNVKTMKLHVKICDQFGGDLVDEQGEVVHSFDDCYVPSWFPENGGDYLVLDIDIDTGIITNWEKPTARNIEESISEEQ